MFYVPAGTAVLFRKGDRGSFQEKVTKRPLNLGDPLRSAQWHGVWDVDGWEVQVLWSHTRRGDQLTLDEEYKEIVWSSSQKTFSASGGKSTGPASAGSGQHSETETDTGCSE